MLQWMETDVMFLDPRDVGEGSAALIEHGFDVEVLEGDDWIDPYGPAVWVRARIITELNAGRFLDWTTSIVGPFNGDVSEAGPSQPHHHQSPNF